MIIRTPNRNRYTIISKVPLEDGRLSWKARGLLSYLLSKPDNWTVVVAHLVKEAPDGRDSVRAGLRELEDAGYIRRTKKQGHDGQFDGVETEVFEEPTGNGFSASADGLTADGLSVDGKPDTNEEGLLKINDFNESCAKTEKPSKYQDDFNALWKVYPRKSNKQGAYKKFLSTLARLPDVDYLTLFEAVGAYARSREGEDEKYTLHGATFFGPDERWRDWVVEPISASEQEFIDICAIIYDQWDSEMRWVNPDTNEESFQNPSIGGYKRPRGPQSSFVASDGTFYEFDLSGQRRACLE